MGGLVGGLGFYPPGLVITRRSILGSPTEGRPGPSDENDENDDDDDDDEARVDFECHKEEKRARSIPIILSYAQHYRTRRSAFSAFFILIYIFS